jgi:Flp pilus assembly protein TadB
VCDGDSSTYKADVGGSGPGIHLDLPPRLFLKYMGPITNSATQTMTKTFAYLASSMARHCTGVAHTLDRGRRRPQLTRSHKTRYARRSKKGETMPLALTLILLVLWLVLAFRAFQRGDMLLAGVFLAVGVGLALYRLRARQARQDRSGSSSGTGSGTGNP